MFFISRTQRWTHKAWDFHLHSGFIIFFVVSSARSLARLSVTSWFPRESLRHSHFAVMWLVCWTDRKQTTNTIEKGMLFGCEQPFLWGERCVTSQKTAAKETRFFIGPGDRIFVCLHDCTITTLVSTPWPSVKTFNVNFPFSYTVPWHSSFLGNCNFYD